MSYSGVLLVNRLLFEFFQFLIQLNASLSIKNDIIQISDFLRINAQKEQLDRYRFL